MTHNTLCNQPSLLQISGSLDLFAFEQALTQLVERSLVVTANATSGSGKPTHAATPATSIALHLLDLTDLAAEVPEQERTHILQRLITQPHDLADGKLHVKLLKLREEYHLLLLDDAFVGCSTDAFLRELNALYADCASCSRSTLIALPVQYPDYYSVRTSESAESGLKEDQLAYWRKQLANLPIVELPSDYRRPKALDHADRAEQISLGPGLTEAVRALSDRLGAALPITLLAAFKVQVARLSGQYDVVVGAPIAGSKHLHLEGRGGCVPSNLVLRTDLSADPAFAEVVARVHQTSVDAYVNQDVPLEQLLAELQPERGLDRTALFQFVFNMTSDRHTQLPPADVAVSKVAQQDVLSKVDLAFYVHECEDQIDIRIVYRTSLFKPERMAIFLQQYRRLLEQVAQNPNRQIGAYTLSTPNAALPDPTAPLSAEWIGAVHELFADWAGRAPDKEAIRFAGRSWTYGKLDRCCNQLAHYLRVAGVQPQEIVAIYAERCPELIVAILATMKAGVAFLLLDPAHPLPDLVARLQSAQPRTILNVASRPLPNAIASYPCPRIFNLLLQRAELAALPQTAPPTAVGPDDIAVITFTSGSSGRPKGILGRHGSLTHFLPWQQKQFALNSHDRYCMLSGLAHDPLQRDIFTPLSLGATICIPTDAAFDQPGRLAQWMADEQITVAQLTPAMIQMLVTGATDCQISSLNNVFLIGDELTKQDVISLRSIARNARVCNSYGATETQRAVAYYHVTQTDLAQRAKTVLPLGRGLHDVQLLVLADNQRLAAVGELGQLAVRSPHLAHGYLNDERLSRACFITSPFTGKPGDRLYLTGDQGRYLPTGAVEFAGRRDSQVQIRGFRVEPAEITHRLRQHPDIGDAAVLLRHNQRNDKQLVAYVVWQNGPHRPAEAEIRAFLSEQLPNYMLPSAYVVLDKLPLTPSGKLDRRALPMPDHHADPDTFVAPHDVLEQQLAGIWADVLGVQQVGRHDHFFQLGGHSLLAMRVIARLRSELNIELPLKTLFESPILASWAGVVARTQPMVTSGIVPVARTGEPLPLSYAQQRLWFLDKFEPNSAFYNIFAAIRMQGRLKVKALQQSLNYLIKRHEILRTSFTSVDGIALQIIQEPAPLHLPVVVAPNEAAARRLAQAEAATSFDLETGPLLRPQLLQLAENEHWFLLTMHHIVSDGWSMGVFIDELNRAYAIFSQGGEPAWRELPIQYVDYAVWQRNYLNSERLDRQLTYWREQLAGSPALLELPTDHPRPAVQRHHGAYHRFTIDGELRDRLQALAQRHDTTLFMALLAAFQLLLARYSNQSDIVVGTPIANRTETDVEGLIGFFVNTLALRSRLDGNPTFVDLLAQVRAITLAAYEHQDLPYEQLVDDLNVPRSLSHSPLFQVMFVLQNAPATQLNLPNLKATRKALPFPFAKFDLTLSVVEETDGLVASLEYDTDLFEPSTIARMAQHFALLLAGIVAQPNQGVMHLPLLTEQERRQIISEWNDTAVNSGTVQTVHALFERQASQTPDAIALVYEDQQLTYAELDEKSNQLANYLQANGVGLETPVGICLHRHPDLIIAMLAVIKSGGAYIPLDPTYPMIRLGTIVQDTRTQLILTQSELMTQLPPLAQMVDIKTVDVSRFPSSRPTSAAATQSLLYTMFTSGSTGRPKGIEILHRNVLRLVKEAKFARLDAKQTFLQLASISFDAATFEIWGSLCNGAKLTLYPGDHIDLSTLGRVIVDNDVSIMFLTTALFHQMVEWNLDGLRPLEQLLVGGEVTSPQHVRTAIRELSPKTTFIACYGPTENTTFTTTIAINDVADVRRSVPIGKPIGNSQVYILNEVLQLTPIGVAGELYTGGEGVARGYLNRPKLTAERFIEHPEFGRLYRTGDLCRWQPDGNIEFLGRNDFQVKIRGFRIEPGEIENALLVQNGVREAVVLAHEYGDDKRLVAYYVGQDPPETVRHELARHLPDYMLPTAYVLLDAMPLTANGKLDRHALPEPDYAAFQASYIPPATVIEQQLAAIWAAVLGLEQIGRHDDFFELGGHSLLATKVVSRLRRKLGVELPLRELFAAPKLASFAQAVDKAQPVVARRISPVPRTGNPMPMSFAQERIWFLSQLQPNSASYNIPTMIRLRGHLHVNALLQSFSYLVERHESLRTTFSAVDGEPVQVIHEPSPIALHITPVRAEAHALRLAEEEAATPFDLAIGPLLRVRLLQLAEHEHLLLLTLHHIISDGWSMSVLIAELNQLYSAYVQGDTPELHHLPIQYADYALWQRDYLSRDRLARQLAYWREQLAAAPALLELPTDHLRPRTQTYQGGHHSFTIDADLRDRLQRLAQDHDATLYMLLLATFNVLLARYSNQTDIVVGTPIANRTHVDSEGLVGFFVNTLALRSRLDGNPTFADLLSQVRATTLTAYEHQDLPFEQLVGELDLPRSLSHNPLFQVMFILHNEPAAAVDLPNLTATPESLPFPFAKFDLTLSVTDAVDGLEASLEYSSDLFERSTVARMASQFTTLLAGVVADPNKRVMQLPLLTPPERRQLVHKWNDTAVDFGPAQTIHALFEQQVSETPDATAVFYENEAVTYTDLNARANQLAHHLLALGIQPDSLVAVALERSVQMVVSLLAVLKAGGAFVPIDPTNPAERVAYMLTDSDASLVLKQSHIEIDHPTAHFVNVDDCIRTDLPFSNPQVEVTPSQRLYVLYTSGTAGVPKGVEATHYNTFNRLNWMWQTLPFEPGEVVCQKTRLSFVDAVWEIFGGLLRGIPTVIVPRAAVADLQQFVALLAAQRVTRIVVVPSLLQALLESYPNLEHQLPHLKQWTCSGEALSTELCRRFHRALPDCVLINLYGSSEVAADVTCYQSTLANERSGFGVPIGRPIANTRAYIVDQQMQPVPVGCVGELYVGGAQVAQGYWNRPELTAERFIEHSEYGRLYRTGDLCRWLPDGHIDFVGRNDFQVKIRGFRIEPGEIENALLGHDGVREAVALARDYGNDRRLVAYYVGHANPETVRQELARRLPDYMLPAAYVSLDAMPLTPNGKLDRAALPEPDCSINLATFVPPCTPLEQQLADIWASLLDQDQVGRHDDFFELGGHSLLGVRLFHQLQQAFGIRLPLATLLEAPTVAKLAPYLCGVAPLTKWSSLVPIKPSGSKLPFFCVHGAGGNVVCYRDLVMHLDDEQPVYGLQSKGLDGKSEMLHTIEEMAAHYIREIRLLHPDGPYLLGGLSFGGMLAFEIAQQLTRSGHDVPVVALFDTSAEYHYMHTLPKSVVGQIKRAQMRARAMYHLGKLFRLPFQDKSDYLRGTVATLQHRLSNRLWRTVASVAHKSASTLPKQLQKVKRANYAAMRRYQLSSYPGNVTLFRVEERSVGEIGFPACGWEHFAENGVEIIDVPGTHVTMIEPPHVHKLGAVLQSCLDAATFDWNSLPTHNINSGSLLDA